jgi:hypothetical protein
LYGEMLAHASPLLFADHEVPPYVPSGELGADTESLMKGLFGLTADEYCALTARGAFGRASGRETVAGAAQAGI